MGARAFVGRQPIVDREQRVVGYEILYRASRDARSAVIEDESQAVLQVMAHTFATLGPDAVLGTGRGFFNVNRAVLLSDAIEALPTERVMIEVLENVVVDDAVIRRCRNLTKRGFSLALDDWAPDDERGALLPFVELVKVDLPLVPVKGLRKLARDLSARGVALLAEKVETQEEFERCLRVGFDLYQGYFFAKPVIIEGASLDASKVILVQLMQLCMTDGETVAIVDRFKQDAKLSLNLLRVVNSAGRAGRVRFETIEEAILQLGREQLGRWLSILLYANGETGGLVSPLFYTAAHRGRLMERIAGAQTGELGSRLDPERAFMVGMLSLVDALLGQSLPDLVTELGLADDIAGPLLERSGELGELLGLAEAIERADIAKFEPELARWSLDLADLQRIEDEAYRWLHGVASGASSDDVPDDG
jgi:EAL and modified HD-GYP domain-containing signal transduction protein